MKDIAIDLANEHRESNQLIAEFMGQEFETSSKEWEIQRCLNNGRIKKPFVEHLDYNVSWDWLMPVVEKIESLNFEIDGEITSADVHIMYGDCKIVDEDGAGLFEFYFHSTDSKDKRKATYKAVIEFIKWYNNESKV